MTNPKINSWEVFIRSAGSYGENALYIAFLTDALQCGKWCDLCEGKETLAFEKLLDIRVFDRDREFRAWRDNIAEGFLFRSLDDNYSPLHFDEVHLLDVDTTRVQSTDGKTTFQTMTGGAYTLPVPPDTNRVWVRTYFEANRENGIEYPTDWRVIGFLRENEPDPTQDNGREG